MQEIQLTKGFTALVDDADYEWLSQWSWCSGVGGYAIRTVKAPGSKSRRVLGMHVALMQPTAGVVVDHVNGDPMDNRRENLRLVSQAENIRNQTYDQVELGRWVATKPAARMLGVKPDRMPLLVVYGGLPATNFVSRWLFWREDLEAFKRDHSQAEMQQMAEDCLVLNSHLCRGEL